MEYKKQGNKEISTVSMRYDWFIGASRCSSTDVSFLDNVTERYLTLVMYIV